MLLHDMAADLPVEDCACEACEWTRWWESLTPLQQDHELRMMTQYTGGDDA